MTRTSHLTGSQPADAAVREPRSLRRPSAGAASSRPAPREGSGILRELLVGGLVFSLAALLSVAQLSASHLGGPRALEFQPVFILQAAPWTVWWLATPLVLAINRRAVARRLHWKRALVAHALLGASLALVPTLLVLLFWEAVGRGPAPDRWWWEYRTGLGQRYGWDCVTYVAVASVSALFALSRRAESDLTRAARLEAELTSARLTALTRQVQPHFLFNALNAVAMLIREGANERALRTVLGYAELLRTILYSTDDEVTVHEELQFLRRYLEVEELRFPDTVTVEIRETPEASRAVIPRLILQPLVENALRHGVPPSGAAVLRVDARVDAGRLRLTVADNGPGLRPDWREELSPGVGVRNTRARLRHRYGDDFAFRLVADAGGGVVAEIVLPYETAPQGRDRGP